MNQVLRRLLFTPVNVLAALRRRQPARSGLTELDEVRRRAHRPTDISDHLETLFWEALTARPAVIVELGVRDGESTFAFERAARLARAALVSVDLRPASYECAHQPWWFVQQDDVAFGRRYAEWAREKGLPGPVDVLFIDTSHEYEHTVQELRVWLPHLAGRGKVLLHDTNMEAVYRRADGSLGAGWSNSRGVVRALADELGLGFDERRDGALLSGDGRWLVRHRAVCNGLTILDALR